MLHKRLIAQIALCFVVFVTGLIIVAEGKAAAMAPDEAPTPGISELSRLDLLPKFKDSVKVASISSYDRTGGNDDGFSGKYSFVRKEGDGLVIADLQGPGVIYRIWTPLRVTNTARTLSPGGHVTLFYLENPPTTPWTS